MRLRLQLSFTRTGLLAAALLSTPLASAQGAPPSPTPPPPTPRAPPAVGPEATSRPASGPPSRPPRPGEVFLGLGFGNAVCDQEKPDSDCPVDGAGAFTLGGGYRVSRSWSLGLELAFWNYNVRKEWQGQLEDQATDVDLSSFYIAPYARWYFMNQSESLQAFTQFGFGFGAFTGFASNAGGKFDFQISGFAIPVGVGFEWPIGEHFRLGPQGLAYLQVSRKVCSQVSGAAENCETGGEKDNALPWRLALVGTVIFGKR